MAFTRNTNGNGNQQSNDENWKADGFINLWLPQPDGSRKKVGAIPLKAAKPFEMAISQRLKEGGEEALKGFANLIEFEYNSSQPQNVDPKGLGF